jgi:multiple sugar transport system ATP-binding protein
MDEPLSNLDAKLRVQTRSQIATLQAKLGVTTVYVTHDQVEAMTMGHRVAVLLDGVLQQVDTPRALYDTPGNVFVAGFMGSPAMNLKTVPLTETGATFGALDVPLTREQVAAAQSGDLVEDLGSDANVYGHAALDGGSERFVVRTDRRNMPSMGETVYIRPQTSSIHLFNATSGQRI